MIGGGADDADSALTMVPVTLAATDSAARSALGSARDPLTLACTGAAAGMAGKGPGSVARGVASVRSVGLRSEAATAASGFGAACFRADAAAGGAAATVASGSAERGAATDLARAPPVLALRSDDTSRPGTPA